MYRIGGRLRSRDASFDRVIVGIPPLQYWVSNQPPLSGGGTMSGGEFDWGGRLRKEAAVKRPRRLFIKNTGLCKTER